MNHPLELLHRLAAPLRRRGSVHRPGAGFAAARVFALTMLLAWAGPAMAADPVIVSDPDSVATEDVDYTFDVEATDGDADPLTFSLLVAPSGMIINTETGVIQWTSLQEHLGDTTVSVEVTDGGATDTLTYTLTGLPASDPPVVSVPDTTFAEDDELVLDMKPLVDDPDDADNEIIWSVSGTSALTATITDTVIKLSAFSDFEGSEQITFTATDAGGLSHNDYGNACKRPARYLRQSGYYGHRRRGLQLRGRGFR